MSAKTCEGSNQDTDPFEDMRCLLMPENVTPPRFAVGDGPPALDQLEGGAGTAPPSPTVNASFTLLALDGVAKAVPLLATITMS